MYVYHSHFNSTEQVGSGLYGALIVRAEGERLEVALRRPARRRILDVPRRGPLDYVINGKSFPAIAP